MNVFVQGVGEVALNNSNFIFQGGEGSIYAKGDSAFKIYIDPKKMIPTAKIGELQAIEDDKVIRPKHLLLDKKGKPIGYSMRYLTDTASLCQLFTKAFRDRNHISNDMMLKLVLGMQKTVSHIHGKKILIVDLNEMNFLVSKEFKEVYFIDVDSYQTPGFPATALMESVRDRHSKTFNEGTDWFSFAIVSFQMFIGIHPYKGKHYMDMEGRMVRNISVLNKEVAIPRICPSFDIIPEVWRRWYEAVLEKGDRLAPPSSTVAHAVIAQTIKKVLASDKFEITPVHTALDGDIVDYTAYRSRVEVVTTTHSIYVNTTQHKRSGKVTEIGFSPKMDYVIECTLDQNTLRFQNLTLKQPCTGSVIRAQAIMSYYGRIYALSGENVLEISFSELGGNVVVGTRITATVMERATSLFKGVAIQNMLGSYYGSFFPTLGTSFQVKLPELDSYKIVDAKFDNQVMIVVASKGGKYDEFIFRFTKEFTYTVRVVRDIALLDINFVTLENGIVASINHKENLELFPIKGDDIKEIESDAISSNMTLYKNGTRVMFARDQQLYTLKMKGNS